MMTTKKFLEDIIGGKVALNEMVYIPAQELLALMTENIEVTKEKNQAVLQLDLGVESTNQTINRLRSDLAKSQANNVVLSGKVSEISKQEKIQRDRANCLEKQLSIYGEVTVSYTKGDLLNFTR